MSLTSDDELSALLALRDTLADALDDCAADKKAPLAGQFRETVKRIAEIQSRVPGEGSAADRLAEQRAKRRATPVRDGRAREA